MERRIVALMSARDRQAQQELPHSYSDVYVARVKALLKIVSAAKLAARTGIPHEVLRNWASGKRRGEVQPDAAFVDGIFEALE